MSGVLIKAAVARGPMTKLPPDIFYLDSCDMT
jgi:hypothetical protein